MNLQQAQTFFCVIAPTNLLHILLQMSVTVDFSEVDTILVATAEGVFDAQSDEITDQIIAKRSKDGGFQLILIDFRKVDGMPAPMESYHSGASLQNRGFTRDMKIAVLDRLEFKEANDFYELVARNRGFMMRHFYTEEEAYAWLRE